jgi:hypothetical protein
MIEIPDRHEMDEAAPQGPIIIGHRFAARLKRAGKDRDAAMAVPIVPIVYTRRAFDNFKV